MVESVQGGFVQINKKVWKGVIRTQDGQRILWSCGHTHSRAEYNARHPGDTSLVWEASAMNCGREAAHQFRSGQDYNEIGGLIGLVGNRPSSGTIRPDTRAIRVLEMPGVFDARRLIGQIYLSHEGERKLRVEDPVADTLYGEYLIDRKKLVTRLPSMKDGSVNGDYILLANAIWGLTGSVWGLIFQDYNLPFDFEPSLEAAKKIGLDDEETAAILLNEIKKPARLTTSHISYNEKTGGYEVVGPDQAVVGSFKHRGEAREKLVELKQKGQE